MVSFQTDMTYVTYTVI